MWCSQTPSERKKESKMSTERRKVLQTEELLYEAVLLCVPSAGVFTFLPVAKMEKLDCGAVAFLWMTSPFGRAYPAHHRPDHGTMWFSKRLSDWVTDIPCCVAFRVFTTLTLPQSGLAREKPREKMLFCGCCHKLVVGRVIECRVSQNGFMSMPLQF